VRYLRRCRRRSVRLRRQLIVQADADDIVVEFAVDREAAARTEGGRGREGVRYGTQIHVDIDNSEEL
jgi:hypothetical protein